MTPSVFPFFSWNLQGKSLSDFLSLWPDQIVPEQLIFLQELGGIPSDAPPFVQMPLGNFTVFHSKTPSLHRRLSIILSNQAFPHVSQVIFRNSFLAVRAHHIHLGPLWLLSAHLPHSGRPLEDFQNQLASLQTFLLEEAHDLPIISGLDANVEPCHGTEDPRQHIWHTFLMDVNHVALIPPEHTHNWHSRHFRPTTIDYVLLSQHFERDMQVDEARAQLQVQHEWSKALGTDHCPLLCNIVLPPRRSAKRIPRFKVYPLIVDSAAFGEVAHAFQQQQRAHRPLSFDWTVCQHIAKACKSNPAAQALPQICGPPRSKSQMPQILLPQRSWACRCY